MPPPRHGSKQLLFLRLAKGGFSVVGLLLLAGVAANAWIISATKGRIFDHISRLADYDVGVVLGTSPYTGSGAPNLLFKHRMRAAAELYKAGKVRHLLVSGANPGYYNEPQMMYQALRRLGVPHAAITLDFAGYSTLDSIVRARRIFGLDRYIIVSQRFHDYRALFIADHYGIDAIAYVRPEEDLRQPFATEVREYLARIKAVFDLFVWGTEPRFLGPRLPIEIGPRLRYADAQACRKPGPEWLDAPWRYELPDPGPEQSGE